jgi:hypothetical protein
MLKHHHAAALALLGWYLIMGDPPLSKGNWGIFESFDTAAECKKDKEKLIEEHKDNNQLAPVFRHATCVATDDPRLRR